MAIKQWYIAQYLRRTKGNQPHICIAGLPALTVTEAGRLIQSGSLPRRAARLRDLAPTTSWAYSSIDTTYLPHHLQTGGKGGGAGRGHEAGVGIVPRGNKLAAPPTGLKFKMGGVHKNNSSKGPHTGWALSHGGLAA